MNDHGNIFILTVAIHHMSALSGEQSRLHGFAALLPQPFEENVKKIKEQRAYGSHIKGSYELGEFIQDDANKTQTTLDN